MGHIKRSTDSVLIVSQERRCASRPLLQLQYGVGRRRRQASKVRCQQWCHCGRKAQLFHPRNSDPFLLMIFSFLHQCYRNPDTSEVKLSKDAWPSVAHTMTITPESGTSSSLRLQLQGLSSFFQANDPALWQPVSGLGEPRADSESAVSQCHRCTHLIPFPRLESPSYVYLTLWASS